MAANLTARSLSIRLLFSVAALVFGGWLLVSWHDERLQTQGILLLSERPPQPVAALERFRDARFLSASLQPEQFEASTVFLLGDRRKAESQLRALLAREPENRTGWLLLGKWLSVDDPPAAARAFERAAQLDGNISSPATD